MWPFKRKPKPKPKVFTGNCMVFQHTADGYCVGRCYHSTYNGRCHLHGDVSAWLEHGDWPNDFDTWEMHSGFRGVRPDGLG